MTRKVARGEDPDTAALQATLGIDIDPELMQLALTHRSYAYEHGGIPTNERLEFLGDSILGQAITVKLYTENPTLDEGDLAKRRASVVSSQALAEVGRGIDLGSFVRLGRGEDQSGGRDKASIIADTVEAIIGATFLDAGADVATDFVLRLIGPLLDDDERFGVAMDPKTSLQEAASRRGAGMPVYTLSTSGPDHNKRFHARVDVAGHVSAAGDGTSKKQAEMAAALAALTELSSNAGSRSRATRSSRSKTAQTADPAAPATDPEAAEAAAPAADPAAEDARTS